MSDKKEVTIGITINLENYENLRLEVEGDVKTQEDADELVAFLDGILSRLGRGDPATAERIDAYRRRVLTTRVTPPTAGKTAQKPTEKAGVAAAKPAPPADETRQPVAAEKCPTDLIEEAIPAAPEQPHPPVHLKPPAPKEEPAPEKPAPEPEPVAKPAAPANKPASGEAEATCETCGAPVTKSQAKLAQLFTGKTLCKKCMEQP
ncbi:hypothetical protein ABH15_06380 [Methanoculleus taiwanensis]|uniref:Uncharacterized protein n=1 Tax=Methanoculleus taiwanensis TaxID=1550565 RepID=A0A498H0H6_9EURY|nr:hypothetical protein [Methanoculleus taiwanensis]RXE55845.1 hypothetical protein ABH15_06380 [Methanoculleus taiwanensis]